jgi:hypothetical protein
VTRADRPDFPVRWQCGHDAVHFATYIPTFRRNLYKQTRRSQVVIFKVKPECDATASRGVQHDTVHGAHKGRSFFQNVIRFPGMHCVRACVRARARVCVISHKGTRRNKEQAFPTQIFMKLANGQQQCVRTSYAKFCPNWTTNVEGKVGNTFRLVLKYSTICTASICTKFTTTGVGLLFFLTPRKKFYPNLKERGNSVAISCLTLSVRMAATAPVVAKLTAAAWISVESAAPNFSPIVRNYGSEDEIHLQS